MIINVKVRFIEYCIYDISAYSNFLFIHFDFRNGKRYENEYLEKELIHAFERMRMAHPNNTMSSDQEKKSISGILKFKQVVSNGGYVTGEKAVQGFEIVGQHVRKEDEIHCPILGYENSTVNIIIHCMSDI